MSEKEQLRKENDQLRHQLSIANQQINLLQQKLDLLARRIFGKKTEQLSQDQLEFLMSGLSDPTQEAPEEEDPELLPMEGAPKRKGKKRIRVPEDLEVKQEVIIPDLVQADPENWKCIGEEKSRRLDYQPGHFFWLEILRPKYVRKDQRQLPPLVAPAKAQVVDHGLAAPGLLAQLLVSRFADHLPYYRQEQIFRQRYQVYIARQQMVQWVEQSTRLLSGITDCLKEQLRRSPYAQLDETPIKYQDPSRKGSCKQGFLWTALIPNHQVYYQWHASRGAKCLESLLGQDFEGKIQCDGYSAYQAYATRRKGIQLFGCWAHARRKFFEAKEQAPRIAGWIINQMGWLYHWEDLLRQSRAGPVERMVFRSQHSRMVVERLERLLKKIKPKYLPQSAMGKAISYALNQWLMLKKYLDHGEVEISNNLVENAIRPTAIGKKNWLFMGSEEAGERNAVIYTLVENCRMHDIEPYTYLKDVLERLPTATNQTVQELTPLNWQKNRQQPAKVAA
jgi:transposase